jgi:hypothetical protein
MQISYGIKRKCRKRGGDILRERGLSRNEENPVDICIEHH